MANEFKVKKGLIVDGSNTVLDIQGTQGQLFSVTDSLTGDLFSVSDVSGIPILNVNSDGTVTIDGNLNLLGDNDKIQLGNSQDLQIYHDGTDSLLVDNGTGVLKFFANGNPRFQVGSDVHVLTGTDFAIAATRKFYLDGQSNTYITESSADTIKIFTGGTEVLELANNAATFAGETSQIYNPGNAGAFQYLKNVNAGNGAYISKKWQNNDAGFGEIWRNSSARNAGVGNTASSFNMYNSAAINFWPGASLGLTLDASQNATFAGDVQAAGIYVGSTNTSYDFYNNGTSYLNGAVTVDAAFTQSGAAASTFSGNVTATNILTVASPATGSPFLQFTQGGTQKSYIQYVDSGDSFELQSDNQFVVRTGGSTTALTINSSQNATFAGDVTVDGNLSIQSMSPFDFSYKDYTPSNTVGITDGSTATYDDWFAIGNIGEADGVIYLNLKFDAHSSYSFTLSRGYHGSNVGNITCTSATYNSNSNYGNLRGIRIIKPDDGSGGTTSNYSVQVRLVKPGTGTGYFKMYAKAWGGGYNDGAGSFTFLDDATNVSGDGTGHIVIAQINDISDSNLGVHSNNKSIYAAKDIVSEGKVAAKGGLINVGGMIMSNDGDNGSYDRVVVDYTGYNSGDINYTWTPQTTPGSGIVRTDFRFQNTNGTSSTTNNLADLYIGGKLFASGCSTATHQLENTTSNGTVLTLKSTGDNRYLYLQTDHVYSNGKMHFGQNGHDTEFRGDAYLFRYDYGNIKLTNSSNHYILFERGSGDYSTKIGAGNHAPAGYTAQTQNYWVDVQSKGGMHVVLNTDGSYNSGENAYDHFTIWQNNHDNYNARQFYVTNVGNVYAKGDVVAYQSSNMSDVRLKKDIKPIKDALDKVKKLNGVNFTWKKDNKKSIGFVAQEIEKVLPELVKTTPAIDDPEKQYKSVNYSNVVAVLVEAIKDQQKQIDELKKLIKDGDNL